MRRATLRFWVLSGALVAHAALGATTPGDVPTAQWQSLLTKHVTVQGGVDYPGLAKDRQALEGFIQAYGNVDFKGADDKTRKAHYINLYNATMMYQLLRHAVAEKIDLTSPAFLAIEVNKIALDGGNVWQGPKVQLGGHDVTLDDIEHGLIRGQSEGKLGEMKVSVLDPRIHAAVNCAAISCPRVREIAYTPDNVEALLDENMRAYVSSEAQFSKVDADTLRANQIVYWYYEDFDAHGTKSGQGGAGGYLASFLDPTAKDRDWKAKHLKDHFNDRGKISLKLSSAFSFHYDWRVNDQRNKR